MTYFREVLWPVLSWLVLLVFAMVCFDIVLALAPIVIAVIFGGLVAVWSWNKFVEPPK